MKEIKKDRNYLIHIILDSYVAYGRTEKVKLYKTEGEIVHVNYYDKYSGERAIWCWSLSEAKHFFDLTDFGFKCLEQRFYNQFGGDPFEVESIIIGEEYLKWVRKEYNGEWFRCQKD